LRRCCTEPGAAGLARKPRGRAAQERRYDAGRGMSLLVEDFVSRASALQRRGRAGRVRAGHCFGLYTRHRFEHRLRKFQACAGLRYRIDGWAAPLQDSFVGCNNVRGGMCCWRCAGATMLVKLVAAQLSFRKVGAMRERAEMPAALDGAAGAAHRSLAAPGPCMRERLKLVRSGRV